MTPDASADSPVPQGDYVAAKRHGDLVFTAGMTPRQSGQLVFSGQIGQSDDIATHREAVRLATANALAAARALLRAEEQISDILSMTVFICAGQGFTQHSKLADFASEYLREELGRGGIGCRAAVGAATLPGNAPVEIQLVAVAGLR